MKLFKPGDSILIREIRQGKVWSAKPMIVVEDKPELLAFYLLPGTQWKIPRRLDGSPVGVLANEDWQLCDRIWQGQGLLILAIPGESFAVYILWEGDNFTLKGWYINLQQPYRRTSLGFDTLDHLLDVVVNPDRSEWQWKDLSQLEEALSLGIISPSHFKQVCETGKKALGFLQMRKPPFNEVWLEWRPNSSWLIPTLPENWMKLD